MSLQRHIFVCLANLLDSFSMMCLMSIHIDDSASDFISSNPA